MTPESVTGERLTPGDALFAVDLAQHRAAYRFAAERARGGPVLDVGCGSGYGVADLAREGVAAVGLDRVAPATASRVPRSRFVRADVAMLPFRPRAFGQVVSFQVLEHLDEPAPYLASLAELVRDDGEVLISTPNARTSLGVNPYHVREYTAEELAGLLAAHFRSVELLGVGATAPVRAYLRGRRRRIEAILRLDPLRLRDKLPRRLRELLFARFATRVRRGIRSDQGLPDVTWRDFPIAPAGPDCLDLLAVCRP